MRVKRDLSMSMLPWYHNPVNCWNVNKNVWIVCHERTVKHLIYIFNLIMKFFKILFQRFKRCGKHQGIPNILRFAHLLWDTSEIRNVSQKKVCCIKVSMKQNLFVGKQVHKIQLYRRSIVFSIWNIHSNESVLGTIFFSGGFSSYFKKPSNSQVQNVFSNT